MRFRISVSGISVAVAVIAWLLVRTGAVITWVALIVVALIRVSVASLGAVVFIIVTAILAVFDLAFILPFTNIAIVVFLVISLFVLLDNDRLQVAVIWFCQSNECGRQGIEQDSQDYHTERQITLHVPHLRSHSFHLLPE